MVQPTQSPELVAAQARTLARLASITSQLALQKGSGRLAGKVCIITGAGSEKGIGRATANLFAKEGAQALYLLDLTIDCTSFDSLALQYPGTKCTVMECDAASEEAVQTVCEKAVEEYGRLDVFFANAGIVGANLLQYTEEEEFMNVMRVNTLSCFMAVKHGSEAMKVTGETKKEGGGSIILTASVAGIRSGAGPIDYSASKAAVINLAATACQTLAGTNIRVNAICPGLIQSGMTTYTFERAEERGTLGKVGQLNPLRRFGIAEEIAPAVLFLASDDGSYVNGISMPVDGGLSSSHPVVLGQAF